MVSISLKKLDSKQLIDEFNNYLFSIKDFSQTEIIRILNIKGINSFQAFSPLVKTMKLKSDQKHFFPILKDSTISKSYNILMKIFFNATNKAVCYKALEAIGLLDWKNYPIKLQNKFKEFLETIIEGAYYDLYRFLARGIAYWHFKDEFKYEPLIGGSYFSEEDGQLIEPLILKMLGYVVNNDNSYSHDYEAAQLAGMLRIKKAIPLLKKACKKIHFVNKGIYDETQDWYNWFRPDAICSLTDIPEGKTDQEVKVILLDILQTDPSFSAVLEAIKGLNFFKDEKIIPYLKGIRHRSIGQFVTEPDEIELAEALEFNLSKRNAEPKNYIEFAAERIVYYRFETFDNNEIIQFFQEFPIIYFIDYEELFVKVVEEYFQSGQNFHNYPDEKLHLNFIAQILVYLDLPIRLHKIHGIITKIKNRKKQLIAKNLVNYIRNINKCYVRTTNYAQTNTELRKYRMVLTNSTRKFIDYGNVQKNFQLKAIELIKQYLDLETDKTSFYQNILDLLYEASMRVIGERKQDLKPAAIVLIKNLLQNCSFLDKKDTREIYEIIKSLVYTDDIN